MNFSLCTAALFALLLSGPTPAAEHTFIASNPGVISATTRSMVWSVSGVGTTVKRAEIRLELNFDNLAGLRMRLVRNGNRFFELASGNAGIAQGRRLQGEYRFADQGVGSWLAGSFRARFGQ